MKYASAARAYSQNDLADKTSGRSPEELVSLLFDKGCMLILKLDRLLDAEEPDVAEFSTTVQKAVHLVLSLRAILDLEQGGEVAQSLYEAYSSIATCLFKQIREKNPKDIAKLHMALSEIRQAWQQSMTQS